MAHVDDVSGFDSPFSKMLTYVFPKNCFEVIFFEFNIFHPECTKLVVSRLLGIAIIFGSVLVKVPQIVKIVRANSGDGVSFTAQFIELISITATGAYSYAKLFPFSSYGEAVFLGIQTSSICYLIWYYDGRKTQAAGFMVIYAAVVLAIIKNVIPISILLMVQTANIPLGLSGRAVQIYENYRSRSTGQLSLITVGLMFLGALARIFTSVNEAEDNLLALLYCLTASTNAIVLAQILFYAGEKDKAKKMT